MKVFEQNIYNKLWCYVKSAARKLVQNHYLQNSSVFCHEHINLILFVAERKGFEPLVRINVHTLSRRAP